MCPLWAIFDVCVTIKERRKRFVRKNLELGRPILVPRAWLEEYQSLKGVRALDSAVQSVIDALRIDEEVSKR
jgi:hypothetical protein